MGLEDEAISGKVSTRNTPLNELNRIFTSITDGIAWNVLSSDLFYILFRQDQLVASVFRNFLLAERIMSSLCRKPVSYPKIPSTKNHILWQAWDLALEQILKSMKER